MRINGQFRFLSCIAEHEYCDLLERGDDLNGKKSTNSYSSLDLSKYISRIYVSVTKLLPLFSCPAYGANIEFIMFCMFYSFEMDV